MKKKGILVGLGMWSAIFSFAQKDTLTGGLPEVVVSANKWEQKQNEIPNTIARINMLDARLHNPQTTADLLTVTGQVFIQKSQLGGGSPMIRGFATNRILIVVDGVRMNNAIYRSGNLQNIISIDPLTVQNAEVIFGPGSIIYGSDAIGGVMDFHTLQPVFGLSKKPVVKLNAMTRFASANNEKTIHTDINVGSQNLSFVGSFTYSDFGDLTMGKHGGQASYLRNNFVERINGIDSVLHNPNPRVQRKSGYNQLNALGKIRYKPSQFIDVIYAYHYSATGNVPRYDRLVEYSNQRPSFAEWYYGPQVWKMHQLQTQFTRQTKMFDNARLTFSMQDYKESRHDRRFRNSRIRNQKEQVNVYFVNLDFNKQLDDKQELYYGAEYVHNNVRSSADRLNIITGDRQPAASRYPDQSRWSSAGIYTSYKYNINQQFTFTAGTRLNYVDLYAPFDTAFFKYPFSEASLKDFGLTGSAGLVFRPSENWQINSNISTGFRVPNIDDIGKVFDSEPGNIIVPNPALTSEYAYNIDLGCNYEVPGKIKVDATVFYTILDNAIVRRPSLFNGKDSIIYEGVNSRVQSLQNVAVANVWGLQAGLEYFFTSSFSWATRANYIDGNETDENFDRKVRLRHAPPFYGQTSIRYNSSLIRAELNAIYNGGIAPDDLAPSEQSKPFIYASDNNGRPYSPSWYTFNLKTQFQLKRFLQLGVGLENITNRRYRPYSSGIVAPGRNFIVSLRVGV